MREHEVRKPALVDVDHPFAVRQYGEHAASIERSKHKSSILITCERYPLDVSIRHVEVSLQHTVNDMLLQLNTMLLLNLTSD